MQRNKNKQLSILYSSLLLLIGVVGVFAYYIISPEIVSEFIALDGHIAPNRIDALNDIRGLSFWIGVVLISLASTILIFLIITSNEKFDVIYNKHFTGIMNFDLAEVITEQWKSISTINKKIFVFNMFVAFICHGFVLSNIIINWDGQAGLFFSIVDHIPSGRWFTAFLGIFSERTFLPIPFGVLSFICLALSGLLLSNLWKCQTVLQSIVVSAFLISFPAFAVGFSYNWICFIYPISTVLAILAVQYALRSGIKNLLTGIVCFVLMLGTYQGFMAFGYAMMLITFIIFIFEKRAKGLFVIQRFVLLGLLSPVIYRSLTNILMIMLNMEYGSYSGANQISIGFIFQHFIKNFILTYHAVINFFAGVYLSMPGYLLIGVLLLLFMALCVLVTLAIQDQDRKYERLSILLFILASPPFIFVTQFLNTGIHSLLIFGFIPIIAGSFYMIATHARKLTISIAYLLSAIILLGFVNRNNVIHLKNYLWTQASLQLATDVAIKIGALPDFSPEMKIVRVGNLSLDKFPMNSMPPFDEQAMTMISATGMATYGEAATMNGIMHFLGLDYNSASINELPKETLNKIRSMPIYPEKGSVQTFGKYVIIKFSN